MAADKDLDRVDREILRLLAADASLSLADIASKVGLTPTPCWKRIRRMEQDGVIRAGWRRSIRPKSACRSRCSSRSRPPITRPTG